MELGLGLDPDLPLTTRLRSSQRGRFSHGLLACRRRLKPLTLEPLTPQPQCVTLLVMRRQQSAVLALRLIRVRVRVRVRVKG